MSTIVPVVLCGGSGTRLWPKSRAARPKPFIPLLGEQTLYQTTLKRFSDRTEFERPVVVVGKDHLELAKPQAQSIAPDALFIVEPLGRNTAPAIAMAALALDPECVMLVSPSDHRIVDEDAFRAATRHAVELAELGYMVSFGIEATTPETGYGYIRRGEKVGNGFRVRSFVEKPDLNTAINFLADGGYAWNGGIFAFKAGEFLTELAQYRPEMSSYVVEAFSKAARDVQSILPEPESFASIEGESVDYALMENTERAAMVDAAMGWSDIGNWNTLLEQRNRDEYGNVTFGPGEFIDARGSMIDSDGPHVTVIGVDDIVVVVDGADVLVTARTAVQRVGEASRCKNQ